jgi:putative ABC transport system permease protein
MFRNYLKIASRGIQKQKFYAFINIAGLTIGITISLLIALYVIDEFSYDKFHKDAGSISRVNLMGRMSGQEFKSAYTPAPLAEAMMKEIPGVGKTCRIALRKDVLIKEQEDKYLEKRVILADSCFFDFFSFRLINGNPRTVLVKPYSLVLTESAANKIFGYTGRGDDSPVGKTLEFGIEKWVCTVTGIAADPPANSHFTFSMLLSMSSWDYSRSSVWITNSLLTYIRLNENADPEYVGSKLSELVKKYIGPGAEAYLGISFEDFLKQGGAYGYFLQPLSSIHFSKDADLHIEPGGNINIVYLLIGIAVFIVIIACINFMNLSTARFSGRAREVGIRKSLGGTSAGLRRQFLAESVMYALLALVLAHLILALILSWFNALAGKQLTLDSLGNLTYISAVLILVIIVGLLAGSYPAFYLTSFRPIEVLRGAIKPGMKSRNIRRILVTFQFTMSTGIIICTLLIFKQLKYVENKDPGFDNSNVIVIRNIESLGPARISFKEELLKMPEVTDASICDLVPPDAGGHSDIFIPGGEDDQKRGSNYCIVDEDMYSTLKLSLIDGRFFSKDFPSDSRAVVINEAAAKLFGWEEPVGKKIRTFWNKDGEDEREVIGVVKDYNYQSLQEEISSLLIFPGNKGNNLMVRLTPGDIKSKINLIHDKWKTFPGSGFFDYSFISDNFIAKFRKEHQMGRTFIVFTILAILIASLGLLGLATFSAEQRSKEIGIRKAMGASSGIIVRIMSMEYLKLVIISFIIAVPLSYLIISWWLRNFAYKTNIGAECFIAGGIIAILTAVLPVGWQSLKAAYRDPVKSLKYE